MEKVMIYCNMDIKVPEHIVQIYNPYAADYIIQVIRSDRDIDSFSQNALLLILSMNGEEPEDFWNYVFRQAKRVFSKKGFPNTQKVNSWQEIWQYVL